ncbi:MAG: hypothetical protein ABTB30_11745, partial [Clostridia bacterium]
MYTQQDKFRESSGKKINIIIAENSRKSSEGTKCALLHAMVSDSLWSGIFQLFFPLIHPAVGTA